MLKYYKKCRKRVFIAYNDYFWIQILKGVRGIKYFNNWLSIKKIKIMKLKIYVALLLSMMVVQGTAQNIYWAKSASGTELDEGNGIAVDKSGHTYITGQFESTTLNFGAQSVNNSTTADYTDIFVAKFDVSGICLWAKSLGGTDDDYGSAIAVDDAGNVYVTGYYQSPTITFGGQTINNAGYDDIFLLKLNASGNAQWLKSFGGSGDEEGTGVSVDQIGNVYLAGYFSSSSIDFGGGPLTTAGGYDIFITKFSTAGNHEWSKKIGGADYERCLAITTDANGNSYTTGYYESASILFGSTTLTNAGTGYNLFVSKINTDGIVSWAKQSTSEGADIEGAGISIDQNGNCYVAGSFDGATASIGSSTLTNNHPGYDNVYTAKYDTDGNFQWAANPVSGPEGNEAYCIAADPAGNCYLSGWYTSPSLTFGSIVLNSSAFGDNIFVAKYNTSGVVQNAYSLSGSGLSGGYGNAIASDSVGNVYLTGYFEGTNMTIGSTTLINTGSWDVYWTKLSCTSTGMEDETEATSGILNPNPNQGSFYINCAADADIQIVNANGAVVAAISSHPGQKADISFLPKGLYFLIIQTDEKVIREKIILE